MNVTEESITIRQQLHDAVSTGHVLIPYYKAHDAHIEPWAPTTRNYDPKGEPIVESAESRIIGTQDIDVAIFTAITGYMGPKSVVPRGSARIMQRVNRFSTAKIPTVSSLYSVAALSLAGKIALRDNEASGKLPTFVYWAKEDQFQKRPGLFPFIAFGSMAAQGAVKVSSAELSINPYELPAVESIDWSAEAALFNEFIKRFQP